MRTNGEQRQDELERYLNSLGDEALLDYTLEVYNICKRLHRDGMFAQSIETMPDYETARRILLRRLGHRSDRLVRQPSEKHGGDDEARSLR